MPTPTSRFYIHLNHPSTSHPVTIFPSIQWIPDQDRVHSKSAKADIVLPPIMSSPPDSSETTCTVLTVTSENFDGFYHNESFHTGVLSRDVLCNVIHPNRARLLAASSEYRLDDLLTAMLEHAPHPLGRRYVALALHVVHRRGEDGVVNAAKAWLDNLFLPSPFVYLSLYVHQLLMHPDGSVLSIRKAIKTVPTASQFPTVDTTMPVIESASPTDQRTLRRTVSIVPPSSRFGVLK
jgi:hypothetical protein